MFQIYYFPLMAVFSFFWILVRILAARKSGQFRVLRELQLILVYICIVVVARFTFFPFSKVDGHIQPLVFDAALVFPPRINLVPFVNLLDYPDPREIVLNLVGNTTMFIPLGIVWPSVFPQLNSHRKVLAAGFCTSLAIEILQLPFFDRVSDVDDLLLNTLGFAVGYGIFLLVRFLGKQHRKK